MPATNRKRAPRILRRTKIVVFLATRAELDAIKDAAFDAHLAVEEYVRLMVLAAAGMGGVVEHLERAIDASWKADKGAVKKQRQRGVR